MEDFGAAGGNLGHIKDIRGAQTLIDPRSALVPCSFRDFL